MAFSPTAAVIVHSLADLDAAVLETLKAEDALLIHRCTRDASRVTRRAVDTAGACFLRVDLDPVLRYHVSASVLEAAGLANYHPGRKLSAQALAFMNATDMPFQFNETPAVLIYEAPSLDPGAGDIPSIDFSIAVEFSDLDTVTYPATASDGGPGSGAFTPTEFVSIPAQATAYELTADCRNDLLLDVFNDIDAFESEPLLATLFAGDPDVDGYAITGDLNLTNPNITWGFDEPTLAYSTRARNSTQIEWGTGHTNPTDETATHVLFTRNGIEVCKITLAAGLLIPAYSGVRAPANVLSLKLTWPVDGAGYSTASQRPGRIYMTYVMGGSRATALPSTNFEFTFYDADPNAAGVSLDSFTVARTAAKWTVAGLTVTPGTFNGTATAPGPGWAITYAQLNVFGASNFPLLEQFVQNVTVGNTIAISGSPVLNLAAAPDV